MASTARAVYLGSASASRPESVTPRSVLPIIKAGDKKNNFKPGLKNNVASEALNKVCTKFDKVHLHCFCA